MYPFMREFNIYLSNKNLSNNTIKKYNTTIQTFAIYVESQKKVNFENYTFRKSDLISYQKSLYGNHVTYKNVLERISKIKTYIQFLIIYKKINITPSVLNTPILRDNTKDKIYLYSPLDAQKLIADESLKFDSRLIILCITLGMPLTDICSVFALRLFKQKECPNNLLQYKKEFINVLETTNRVNNTYFFEYKNTSKNHKAKSPIETIEGLQNIIRSDTAAIGRYLSLRNLRKDLTLYDLFYNKLSLNEVALKYQYSITKAANYQRIYSSQL
ncbi:hypothetical protein [Latilactobacillus sakei]|uniref:hypothetical protein n=1 Tax=Latilactobacillus sakei TaxID=1599 RepID=UPI00202F8F57|nr:hypothetical protein [Latilactobacillus sakei]MCM1636276.1 hypothetical protein [Latilactobacillus sakei]